MLKSSYESEIEEIDEYWDRENQYIKSSGIYTKEEVEQILANHEEIRRSKKAEVKAKYKDDFEMLRDEREQIHAALMAKQEEQAAYDDFITSLDMND